MMTSSAPACDLSVADSYLEVCISYHGERVSIHYYALNFMTIKA